MSSFKNGIPYAEQWQEIETEFDDDDESITTEFDDDDDESFLSEFDDDDDEAIVVEFDDDDDEAYEAEFDDDEEGYQSEFDDDDDESFEAEFLGRRLRRIRRLAKARRRRRSSRFYRPRNFLRHRVGRGRYRVRPKSKLRGSLRFGRRRVPFRLPTNLATKKDVMTLAAQVRKDIRLNSSAIKKNAAGIRTAIGLARKANSGVKHVEKKFRQATLQQTKATNAISKRVMALKKAQEAAQAQARQQAMFSLFMTPELETIKVKEKGVLNAPEREFEVVNSEFETNLLPLVMGMQGGTGTQGGMDPMMMFALAQAFD